MPPRLPPQFHPLRDYLDVQHGEEVTLTFADMDALLGEPLPEAVWQRAWWTNNAKQAQAQAWLGTGWWVRWVRRSGSTAAVTFVRRSPEPVRSNETLDQRPRPRRSSARR